MNFKISQVPIVLFLLLFVFITPGFSQIAFPTIEFETPLTLSSQITEKLQLSTAFRILNSLFYIALCIGTINVVRTFVFYPDRAKKVTTNFLVGIVVYMVISSFLG